MNYSVCPISLFTLACLPSVVPLYSFPMKTTNSKKMTEEKKNRAELKFSSNNGISRPVKSRVFKTWSHVLPQAERLETEDIIEFKMNEEFSPVPCGVKGLAVKCPAQATLESQSDCVNSSSIRKPRVLFLTV